MLPCSPCKRLCRPAVAVEVFRAIAALLFACMACAGPALAASFDPSIPEPLLLPADNAERATPVPVWHSRYADSPSDQTRPAAAPQHRRQQSRRPRTVSGVKQTAYQYRPVAYRSPQPVVVAQNGPSYAGVAVWGDDAPDAAPGQYVEGDCPSQSCGGECADAGGDCGDCVEGECCPSCDGCDAGDLIEFELPFAGRLWARGEYLLWWTRDASLPPLATTSPAGTARNIAGRLDQPTTTILLGDGNGLSSDARSGARVELGYWLMPCQGLGFEVTYLDLGSQTSQFEADSNNFAILTRPFYNLETGSEGQDAALIAFPSVASGSITVASTNKFQSLEGLLRRHVLQECGRTIDFVGGYRYAYLQGGLLIDETMTSLDRQSPAPFGTTLRTVDQFDTQNRFNGGEVGVIFQQCYRRWSLELLMKLALGSTQSQVAINGSTSITPPGAGTTAYTGGILALPTNIGTYEETKFSLMPELGVTLGCDVTRHLRATVGYTFLYWSNVARPGDQIDTEVNASQFPPGTLTGAARPQFVFHTTDFWRKASTSAWNTASKRHLPHVASGRKCATVSQKQCGAQLAALALLVPSSGTRRRELRAKPLRPSLPPSPRVGRTPVLEACRDRRRLPRPARV